MGYCKQDIDALRHRLLEVFYLNDETGQIFWRVATSNRIKVGSEAGTIGNNGYRYVSVDGQRMLAHRAIFLMVNGFIKNDPIDHIDGNPLNNRPSNLRQCTARMNAENKHSAQKNNSLGVLGVTMSRGKFKAQIQVNGRNHCLGRHDNLEDAKMAYIKAKNALHMGYVA